MGRIAQKVIPALAEDYDLRLIDREAATLEGREVLATDITDYAAVRQVMEGVTSVVHLAIASNRAFVTDVEKFEADEGDEYLRFNQATIDVNIRGTYNLVEAARAAGTKRIVYGSSLTVLLDHFPEPLRDDLPPRPINFYAVSKLWGEELGEYFSRRHGLLFYSLRFGAPHPQPHHYKYEGWLQDPFARAAFVTYPDIIGAVRCALVAEEPRYGCYSVVSATEGDLIDTSKGREIGWQPGEFCHADGSITPILS
jgi:nucleoside-diphosphate-sugar epimerase